MILINLLPHRETARKRRRDVFNVALAVSAMLGGLVAGAVFLWYQSEISDQQSSNRILAAEVTRLEGQIKEIGGLESEITALKARQQAVEDLQGDRNQPVYLLSELVTQTPEGIFLKSVKQDGQRVVLSGYAQSNERVSEYLKNRTLLDKFGYFQLNSHFYESNQIKGCK